MHSSCDLSQLATAMDLALRLGALDRKCMACAGTGKSCEEGTLKPCSHCQGYGSLWRLEGSLWDVPEMVERHESGSSR